MPLPGPLVALLEPPEGTPPSGVRLYALRIVVCSLGLVFHLVQIGIFAAVGLWQLMGLSVLSVLWFAGCIAAARSGRGRAAMYATYAEVTAHSLFLTTAFGVDTGYVLYGFAIACGVFLVFDPSEKLERYTLPLLSAGLGVLFLVGGGPVAPWVPLSDAVRAGFLGMNAVGTFIALVGCIAYYANATAAAERAVAIERKRSEDLLLNVLPASIAERLKDAPGTVADHYDSVTVLFADLAGFTVLSSELSTDGVLELLNTLFSAFDGLADRHGLEKIKTIGDAYMVVGGLPEPLDDHAGAIAAFALDLREVVRSYAARGGHPIQVRIGIHTGPVVAGVIGVRKFAYDLWGDTVNTASRMESHGEPDRIHMTDAVRRALGERFAYQDRGAQAIKGKGTMRTWFLEGPA